MNAAGEILVWVRFVQGHSNIVHAIFDHITAEIVKLFNGNNVIHNNSSFSHTIARRGREDNTGGDKMILLVAFVLAVAATWIVNESVRFGYRIHQLAKEREFERWLASHPEV